MSREHTELVGIILECVSSVEDMDDTYIFTDDAGFDYEKPPKLGTSIPDVYVKNLESGCEYIGEAKPSYDLLSARTEKQLKDYLAYMKRHASAKLIVATGRQSLQLAQKVVYPIATALGIELSRIKYISP